MSKRLLVVTSVVCALAYLAPLSAHAAEVKESNYRGWKTLELSNGLVELQVAPDIGGRIIQFKLKDFEFLWVNDQLAGKMPPPTGLGPKGEWLNYGGDKLWPAPQGWSGENEWPGPPGPVIEGTPHRAKVDTPKGEFASVELTSPEDKSTGIQFLRTISMNDGGSLVGIRSVMKNIDTKPRRWGIWEVTQLNCADPKGAYDKNAWAYCPINPKSLLPNGYKVMFGAADNPAFQPNVEKKMMRVHYERLVGKIGMDSVAGWLAFVRDGRAFVERFDHFPSRKYPDDASVEFWLQAPGKFFAAGKENVVPDTPADAPPYMEAEVLSPFAELKPGETYTFENRWFAANIGGNYPILDCTSVGVVAEYKPSAGSNGVYLAIDGRFGVFHAGTAGVVFHDAKGKELGRASLNVRVSPNEVFALGRAKQDYTFGLPVKVPGGTAAVSLFLSDSDGKYLGELAQMPCRWSEYRVKE